MVDRAEHVVTGGAFTEAAQAGHRIGEITGHPACLISRCAATAAILFSSYSFLGLIPIAPGSMPPLGVTPWPISSSTPFLFHVAPGCAAGFEPNSVAASPKRLVTLVT